GLETFAQHFTHFTELLYDEYESILKILIFWNQHVNYDVKKVSQRAYDTFLKGIADALKARAEIQDNGVPQRAIKTFKYFVQEFRRKIESPIMEIRDLAMAIRGYRTFASVSKLED
ncbi:unnamed protein product, partial [Didymodactylos carnosus]